MPQRHGSLWAFHATVTEIEALGRRDVTGEGHRPGSSLKGLYMLLDQNPNMASACHLSAPQG